MPRPIPKTELTRDLAEATGLTMKTAASVLSALSDVVVRRLGSGDVVAIPGLAKFEARARPERQVRNVRTGETISKPADTTVKVTASASLKGAVNA